MRAAQRTARRAASGIGNILLFRDRALRTRFAAAATDEPMRVTGAWVWCFLAALALCIGTVSLWGFLGTVPTRVAGQGMLVADVRATQAIDTVYGGHLDKVLVHPGDYVRQGEMIAHFSQPEREQELASDTAYLDLLSQQRREVDLFYNRYVREARQASQVERAHLHVTVDLMTKSTQTKQALLKDYKQLFASGLATRLQLESATDSLNSAQIQLQQALADLAKTDVDDLNVINTRDAALRDYDSKIADATSKRDATLLSLQAADAVLSPGAGRIATIEVQPDTRLQPGQRIATLADPGQHLEAAVFVSAQDAKVVSRGMAVEVLPTTVKAEEYGAIRGDVLEVGVAPETRSSLLRLLNNEAIVAQFLSAGAPFVVRVRLLEDPHTASGFKWTSGPGPAPSIFGSLSFGSLVTAQIVVREQSPISTVIPTLKRWFGLHP